MSIIAYGTSIADFDAINIGSTNNASQIDTYVKEGMDFQGSGLAALKFPSPLSEFWLCFYVFYSSAGGTARDGVGFFAGTQELFRVNAGTSDSNAISYYNGSTMVINAVQGSTFTGLHRYDVHCKIADSGGLFEVYRDGVLDANFATVSTDTKYTTATAIDQVKFRMVGVSTTVMSAIILADEDTRDMRMSMDLPNAAGSDTGWTGAYTAIDELGITDTDFVTTATLNATMTVGFASIHADLSTSTWAPILAGINVRGVTTASGDFDIAPIVRTGGVNYQGSAMGVRSAAYGPARGNFLINPATSLAWTYAELNAAQFGIRAIDPTP